MVNLCSRAPLISFRNANEPASFIVLLCFASYISSQIKLGTSPDSSIQLKDDIPLAPQDAINDFEFPLPQISPVADDNQYFDYVDNTELPPTAPVKPVFQPIFIEGAFDNPDDTSDTLENDYDDINNSQNTGNT